MASQHQHDHVPTPVRCDSIHPELGRRCETETGHGGTHDAIIAGEWVQWTDQSRALQVADAKRGSSSPMMYASRHLPRLHATLTAHRIASDAGAASAWLAGIEQAAAHAEHLRELEREHDATEHEEDAHGFTGDCASCCELWGSPAEQLLDVGATLGELAGRELTA